LVVNIGTPLPHLAENIEGVSEEDWLGDVLVDQLDVLAINEFIDLLFVLPIDFSDPIHGLLSHLIRNLRSLSRLAHCHSTETSVAIEVVHILVGI
jgi:hypothetical protein